MTWIDLLFDIYDNALLYYPNLFFAAVFVLGLIVFFVIVKSFSALIIFSYRGLYAIHIKPRKTKSILHRLYIIDLLLNRVLTLFTARVEKLGRRMGKKLFIQRN